MAGFTGLGLAATILVEILATRVWHALALQRSHADDPYPGGWPRPAADVGLCCRPSSSGLFAGNSGEGPMA